MFLSPSALVLLYLAHTAAGAALNKRTTVGGTAVVHLDKSSGSPQQLASGILYGIPDQQNQIPDSYYTGINFKYSRAGGAQTAGQGWIGSLAGYKVSIYVGPSWLLSSSHPCLLRLGFNPP